MPRKLPEIVLGPFVGGLNTRLDERFVSPLDAATYARNLDLKAQTLRGMYDVVPVPTFGPIAPAGTVTIWFEDGSSPTWDGSSDTLYVLYGPDWTTTDARKVTYRTQAAGLPHVKVNGQGYTLGIPAANASYASSVAVSDGASGGVRAYAFTYYSSTLEWESNPVFITDTTTNCNGAAITGLPSALVNSATDKRIYATTPGSTDGTYYYIGTVAGAGTTFNDSATAGDTAQPLNWKAGGNPDDVDYPYDHGHWAANLTVLADSLYSVAEGAGAGGGGILFGAKDNTLYWSMLGFPWYQPSTNQQRFDSKIAAIIVGESVAYVITETSIYQITGVDDTTLAISKTSAAFGCPFLNGRSACMTPYGVIFVAFQGLAVFDGSNARLMTEGMINADTFALGAQTGYTSAFGDNLYIALGYAGGLDNAYIVDLSAWPRLRFTTTDLAITTITVFDDSSATGAGTQHNGFFVCKGGELCAWNPISAFVAGGEASRLDWQWQTPRINHGSPSTLKRYVRYRMDGFASSIVFFASGSTVHTATNPGGGEYWLPRTAQGTDIQLRISGDGSDEVFTLALECEAPNG